jgi:hypothetical protein
MNGVAKQWQLVSREMPARGRSSQSLAAKKQKSKATKDWLQCSQARARSNKNVRTLPKRVVDPLRGCVTRCTMCEYVV